MLKLLLNLLEPISINTMQSHEFEIKANDVNVYLPSFSECSNCTSATLT